MRLLLGKKSILSTFILLSLFTQTVCKIGLSTLMKCQNIRHWEYSRALLGLLQGLHELSILCRAFNEKAHGFELVNDQVQFYCLLIELTRSSGR